MLFPTVEFAIFFCVAFAVAWALRGHNRWHKAALLGLSWLFYAWGSARHLPVLVAVSLGAGLVAQRIQLAVDRRHARRWLAFGTVLALATLVTYKYTGFLVANATDLLARLGVSTSWKVPEVELPVGVSFFVFHAISLMVDVYRGNVSQPVVALDCMLYVAFFPQLVAGPVVRASDFLPQIARGPSAQLLQAGGGVALILRGLFKKVVLASHLGLLLADPVFESPADFSGPQVLLGVYAYAGQIYCDFSGYTDIAIGAARLLGYRFAENFDAPYRSLSIQEFWRRWHISLSSFLRDYLYVPLGGSRAGVWATRRNLLVTMLLGGLWHGASWTFIWWGALHGVALVVNRAWTDSKWKWIRWLRARRVWAPAAWVITFHTVCLAWILFRSQTIDDAVQVVRALGNGGAAVAMGAVALVSVGVVSQCLPTAVWARTSAWMTRLPAPVQGCAAGLAVVVIDALGPIGVPPFIYFQF